MLADIDGEAKTLEGRVPLSDHTTHRGEQTQPEEKIKLFVDISMEKNTSLFLGPRNEIRLYHGTYGV